MGSVPLIEGTEVSLYIEIVPLLSCSKDITRQFKDVKSEVDLILAQYHDDLFITSFSRWTWLDKGNREV